MNLPNKITLARMAMIPVYLGFALVDTPESQAIALAVFVLAALTDLVDGQIARRRNMVTDFGKFMDPIADKLLVAAATLVLLWEGRMHPIFAFIFIGREIVMGGFRLVAVGKGIVIAAGSLGKIKTVLQMAMLLVLMIDDRPFSMMTPMGSILLWASTIFALVSLAEYIGKNRDVLE